MPDVPWGVPRPMDYALEIMLTRPQSDEEFMDRIAVAIEQALGVEREALWQRLEEQRQKILADPSDLSWTEHFAEVQSWLRTRGGRRG